MENIISDDVQDKSKDELEDSIEIVLPMHHTYSIKILDDISTDSEYSFHEIKNNKCKLKFIHKILIISAILLVALYIFTTIILYATK